jgi:hypothetical protein
MKAYIHATFMIEKKTFTPDMQGTTWMILWTAWQLCACTFLSIESRKQKFNEVDLRHKHWAHNRETDERRETAGK